MGLRARGRETIARGHDELFATSWRGVPRTLAGLIAVREAGTWSIVVFRNQVPFERPPAGSVERSLAAAARHA